MQGDNYEYNPSSFKGNTAIEKLRFFLSEVRNELSIMGLDSGTKVRFRGDVLEVSVDRSVLTPQQNEKANDSPIYIKTGLLISLVSKAVKKSGLRPVISTFPRFDEPDLVGFVYLSDDIGNRNKGSANINCELTKGPYDFDLNIANNLAAKHTLALHHLKKKNELETIKEALTGGLDCCRNPILNKHLSEELENLPTYAKDKNRKVLIIKSRQNTPTHWIETGLFLGEAISELRKHRVVLSNLNLSSCPSYYQNQLEKIPDSDSYQFAQLVCLLESPET